MSKSNRHYATKIAIYLLAYSLIPSCSPDSPRPETDTLFRKLLQEKLEEFYQAERASCREKLLETASHKADSLLLYEANRISRDTMPPPPPVKRPLPPPIRPFPDSITVAPIWIDTLPSR